MSVTNTLLKELISFMLHKNVTDHIWNPPAVEVAPRCVDENSPNPAAQNRALHTSSLIALYWKCAARVLKRSG